MAHEFTPIEGDLKELMDKTYFESIRESFMKVDGFLLTEHYKEFADAIDNLEIRDDDIWVCSFPKTGTTWTQEMVWCIANDLDFEGAKVPLTDRFPFLEISTLVDIKKVIQDEPDIKIPDYLRDSIRLVENSPSPRFIKTHLPFNLLPRQLRSGETKAKIVYVVRNAKDTCISYYHHNKLFYGLNGSFEDFCNLFIRGGVYWAPFWEHVLGFWEKRINDHILFFKYEDMKKDLPWVLMKTATFLGKNLTTDQLAILTKHLSFASMKVNSAVNNANLVAEAHQVHKTGEKGEFVRDGNVDQWKTTMSPEYIKLFDDWTRVSLKGTRLYF